MKKLFEKITTNQAEPIPIDVYFERQRKKLRNASFMHLAAALGFFYGALKADDVYESVGLIVGIALLHLTVFALSYTTKRGLLVLGAFLSLFAGLGNTIVFEPGNTVVKITVPLGVLAVITSIGLFESVRKAKKIIVKENIEID